MSRFRIKNPSDTLLEKKVFSQLQETSGVFDEDEDYLYATGFISNPKVFIIKLNGKDY